MQNQLGAALILSLLTDAVAAAEKPAQQITTFDQQSIQQAPAENFSGEAQFSRLPIMPSKGDIAPATVTFAPNALTNWHIHPQGQYLIVIDGEGRTQEWGQPIKNIRKGDVIWCPPKIKHWHGASVHSAMTHIALSPIFQDDQKVIWLEKVELPLQVKSETKIETEIKTVADVRPEKNAQEKQPAAASQSLTQRQLSLIPIAAFTATGDLERLKPALQNGLESGLTVNEIKEALAHQYAYAGFPRSLNGLLTFRSLLEQRAKQGITDPLGATPTTSTLKTLAGDTHYYQLGAETLAYLTKAPAEQPLLDNFSPTIDYALKAHLFGYLFSRNNLNYIDRELVTIATLSALGNVNNQLNSHFKIVYNLGLGDHQLQQIIATLDKEVEPKVAKNSLSVLQQLQSSRSTPAQTK